MPRRHDRYVVICQSIVGGGDRPFETVYSWDGRMYGTRPEAIGHGFKLRGSDDFNVGVVRGPNLISFDWMDKPVEGHDLQMIKMEIGL